MTPHRWTNLAANLVASVLIGWGIAAFLCLQGFDQIWFAAALHQPSPRFGLVFQKGDYRYFSALRATAATRLIAAAFPIALVGNLIASKEKHRKSVLPGFIQHEIWPQ